MKNDLIKQAVMAQPALDHQIQAIYVGVCVKSCISGYVKGRFHFLGKNFDRKKFEISCTYIQHIAFRAELFMGRGDTSERMLFNGVVIPRPTPEEYKMLEDSKREEWMPIAGEVCDLEWRTHTDHSVLITYISDEVGCYKAKNGKEFTFSISGVSFRPIKTEREKFISKSLGLVKLAHANVDHYLEVFGEQFDNGAQFKEVDND